MSIRVMTMVWERSAHKGSALILLLAIADFADDNGHAYPSVETLAVKCRMGERNTRYTIRLLEKSGELIVSRGAGKGGANLYRVMIERNLPLFGDGAKFAPAKFAPATDGTLGGQTSVDRGAIAIAPEPSVPVIEPSGTVGRFDRFWKAYPVKEGKKPALEVWKRIKPDESLLEAMLTAITAQRETRKWREGIIPLPKTWLNQRRWDDEIGATTKPVDTTCRRVLPGGSEACGMPGTPDQQYGHLCDHCRRTLAEARTKHDMPPAVREALRGPKVVAA